MKYNKKENKWKIIGKAGFSKGEVDSVSLYVYDGVPYIAYKDYGNEGRVTVKKYEGGRWNSVGKEGFTKGRVGEIALYVYKGIPYVAYSDEKKSYKITVMKYE